MTQSGIVKRIESICDEFDSRVEEVGLAIARLELAKVLAECEAAQPTAAPDSEGRCGHEDRSWFKKGEPCPKCG